MFSLFDPVIAKTRWISTPKLLQYLRDNPAIAREWTAPKWRKDAKQEEAANEAAKA